MPYFDKQVDYDADLQEMASREEQRRAAAEAQEKAKQEELAKAAEAEADAPEPELTLEEKAAMAPQQVADWAPMREQDINQMVDDPKTFGLGENIIEARNAIAKGGAEAFSGALTAPERLTDAAKGEDIGDPNYRPEWDPFENYPTPMVRTWWGKFLESAAHYGTYGAGLVLAAPGFAVKAGGLGVGMASGALGGLLSEQHDSHNLSGTIVKQVPEMELVLGALATKDSDHPLLKKFKNVVEEAGMAGLFDQILGKLFGAKGAEKAIARHNNVMEQIVEKGKQEYDEAIELVQVRQLDPPQLTGSTPKLPGQGDLPALPPSVVKFRGHMNKPIADPWQGSPNSTAEPFDIHEQLNKIDKDPTAANGSTDSVMTPAQAERMATENGLTEEFMRKKAKELIGDVRYQNLVKEAKDAGKSFEDVFKQSYGRYMQMMGRNVDGMTVDEFWKPILDDLPARSGGEDSVEFWSSENVVTGDLVNSALFKQLRDLSIGARELSQVVDVFDTDGPMKTIADRLIIGLANVKKSRYMQSASFRKLQGPKGAAKSKAAAERARKQAFDRIETDTREQINMALQFIGKSDSDKLLDGILEAMSMGNKIENWTDLDNFFRQKLHGFTNENVTLRELSGMMINSILSSVRTGVRAFWGTGSVAFMQPMGRALGSLPSAVVKGDFSATRGHLAAMNAYRTVLPEAFQVFRKRMDSYWSGDYANMRTRFSESFANDEHWEAMERWIELNGTAGDKASFSIAYIARRLNDNRILSYSPRLMASMDDTYKVIMARARARQQATLKALQMKKSGDIFDVQPSDIKNLEASFYNKLVDADGNIDLSKDSFLEKSFKEASLTEDLEGFSAALDNTFSKYPLSRAFYLFARTGINGLNLTYKHTPLVGMLHKKTFDILTADPNNLESVAKYGIQTLDDLRAEKHLVLGRQAQGMAVTFIGMQKYMSGELTGNGPQNRKQREAWKKAGWQPRSIKIGDAWISYDSFEPFSIILATMADIGDNMDIMGEDWATSQLKAQALVLGGAVSSKSYLAGLGQMVDLLSGDPGKSWQTTVGNIANNTIPFAAMRSDFGRLVTPYQRELAASLEDTVRNRNLTTEQFAGEALPIKYDMLNGRPIKDHPFWQRAVNAVLPINLSIESSSPGRRLFLESGYDASTSVYYSPDGDDLTNHPEIRSMYMREIGRYNLEGKLDDLAKKQSVIDSMNLMRSDLANGRREIDPNQAYTHLTLIKNEFDRAMTKAWAKISKDPAVIELKNKQRIVDQNTRDRRSSLVQNQVETIIRLNNYE